MGIRAVYTGSTGGSTLTITNVVVQAGDRLVVVCGAHQGTVSSVVFNTSENLTQKVSALTAFNESAYGFVLDSPTATTASVVITKSGGSHLAGAVYVISGAKSGGPVKTYSNQGSMSSINGSVIYPSNNTLLIDAAYAEADISTPGSDQTQQYDVQGASYENFASSSIDQGASATGIGQFTWTLASDQRTAHIIMAFEYDNAVPFEIQIDTYVDDGMRSAASSRTFSITIGANKNRGILINIGCRDGTTVGDLTVSSVTVGGQNATKKRSDLWNSSSYVRQEIWWIVDPPTGAQNVVVTFTGSVDYYNIVALSVYSISPNEFIDADTGTGTKVNGNEATSSTLSPTATKENTLVVDSIWEKDGSINAGSGQFKMAANIQGSVSDVYGSSLKRKSSVGSVSMSWTWTNSEGHAHGVVILRAQTIPLPTARPVWPVLTKILGLRFMFKSYQTLPPLPTAGGGAPTAIDVTDTGSGSDAIDILGLIPVTDTGSGADTIAILALISITDTGSGADSISILALVSITDDGAGVDTISVLALIPITDTGSGADDVSILALVPITDNGSGSDAISILALVSISELGTGNDSISILALLSVTDTGSGTDDITALPSIDVTDTGSGTDGLSILGLIPISDTGVGSETIDILNSLSVTDIASGADAVSILALINQTDTGAGSDEISITALLDVADSGQGTELINILAQIAVTDTGAGDEAINILAAIAINDTAVADDAVQVLAQIALSDTAQGSDAIQVLALLGVLDDGTGDDVVNIVNHVAIDENLTGADSVVVKILEQISKIKTVLSQRYVKTPLTTQEKVKAVIQQKNIKTVLSQRAGNVILKNR